MRHPVNFINHSCEPNAGYDGADAIVALRRITAGEEICMDYGTFSFSFDHEFECTCGAWGCRGQVRRTIGTVWCVLGLRLPGFMRALAGRAFGARRQGASPATIGAPEYHDARVA